MPFDLGDTVRLEAECRDADGVLATAGTAALTLTLPDGSTLAPEVAVPETAGAYRHDYVTTVPGRHGVRWQFTSPADAYTDAFDVRPAEPPLLLSLADAKAQLGFTDRDDDEELRGWLESITSGVEHLAGVCVRRTVTEVHPAPRVRTLALRRTPVLSLTSVTAVLTGGGSYSVDALDVDGPTGEVRRLDDGLLCGPLRVVYVAGREVIPANLTRAGAIILQHLWRTKRAGARGSVPGGGDDYSVTEPVPGFGYAIPNRALELLEPDRLPPGVA